MFKRILVPSDGSDISQQSVQTAAEKASVARFGFPSAE